MTKYYGKIGFAITKENENNPGVWEENYIERHYYGEVIKNTRSISNSSTVNGELNISNQISILSDPFVNENFHLIRYIEFMGNKWTVTNVEVQYPRLIVSIGGVYNARPQGFTQDLG